jgi:hypothetical protein
MKPVNLSRRELLGGALGGLLAALAACLWPGRSRATAPRRTPAPAATYRGERLVLVTTYTYDAQGRCICTRDWSAALDSPDWPTYSATYDRDGRETRCSYDG